MPPAHETESLPVITSWSRIAAESDVLPSPTRTPPPPTLAFVFAPAVIFMPSISTVGMGVPPERSKTVHVQLRPETIVLPAPRPWITMLVVGFNDPHEALSVIVPIFANLIRSTPGVAFALLIAFRRVQLTPQVVPLLRS